MRRSERRVLRALLTVGVLLTGLFGIWWFEPGHVSANFHGSLHLFDFVIFILVSYVIWHQISMEVLAWSIARKIHTKKHPKPQDGLHVAFITTYVPGAETPELLHNILPAMVSADYPHDTWLLDEGNDPEARRLCLKYGVKYFTRKDKPHYNTSEGKFATKTKGGNHNAWYDYVGKQYDVVAQIDTDFVPVRHFLTHTLGYFRDPTVAWVVTPQVYGNLDSFVAKGAAQQQYSFYGPILRGLFGLEMALMLGANHIVRVSALQSTNYYAGHITEDLLTGMRLHAKSRRSVYVPEQLAIGEGPATWHAYFSQQMQWAYGCIDVLFHHSRKHLPLMSVRKAMHYFFLQQFYFSGLASMIGLILLTAYFVFGITPAAVGLIPMLLVYVPLLVWQYVIQRWLQRFYVNPDTESGPHLNGMIVSIAVWPIYFLALISVLRGKRITFKVTPKGEELPQKVDLRLFTSHIAIGCIALTDLLASVIENRHAVVMVFWAIVTAMSMLLIAFHQHIFRAYSVIKKMLLIEIHVPRPNYLTTTPSK